MQNSFMVSFAHDVQCLMDIARQILQKHSRAYICPIGLLASNKELCT